MLGRKKDDDVWGLIAGLFLGAVGLTILSSAINPRTFARTVAGTG